MLARFGKRTLVIVDVPYVHQIMETYVSKLFSLSYGIASIDVHGGNPTDHFLVGGKILADACVGPVCL